MADYGNAEPEDSRQLEAMRKMFIGGLNRNTSEDSFRDFFQQFGETEDCVIITDPNTNTSRGFGFVTYVNSDCVQEVFKNRPHELDAKTLDCKRAMPREFNTPGSHSKTTRLFVGGFKGLDLEPEELKSYIESRHSTEFGTVEKIDFLKDKDQGTNKGFGFIDCSDNDFADRLAISESSFTLKGRKLSIKKAEPKDNGEGDGRGMRGGRGRSGFQSGRGGRGGGSSRFQSGGGYNQGGGGYNQGGNSYNQGGGYQSGGGGGYQNNGGGYDSNYSGSYDGNQSYGSNQYSGGNNQYGNTGGYSSGYGGASQQQAGAYGSGYNNSYQQPSDYNQSSYGNYNQSAGGQKSSTRGAGRGGGGGGTGASAGRYQPY